MMNDRIAYCAAVSYQEDMLARSARRQLARSVRDQARIARREARSGNPEATNVSTALVPASPPPAPTLNRTLAPTPTPAPALASTPTPTTTTTPTPTTTPVPTLMSVPAAPSAQPVLASSAAGRACGPAA